MPPTSDTTAPQSAPLLPALVTEIPGPKSLAMAGRFGAVESPDATAFGDDFPVVWERAAGASVWDVDGNRYIDMSGAFGVAAVGHAHPRVTEAIRAQSKKLIHGMGDVHPTDVRLRLSERLASLAPGDGEAGWKVVYGLNGADAVEAALKTAALATGKAGVIAFEGGYHGMSVGALSVTAWPKFHEGLEEIVAKTATTLPFPGLGGVGSSNAATVEAVLGAVEERIANGGAGKPEIGAVIIEPIQGRGGTRAAAEGFLTGLREICTRTGVVLIFDEIFTGLGRTGDFWACGCGEGGGVVPDIILAGKALAGGMPLSVCMGRPEIMDKWGESAGESRHTSTFTGHPLGCAAALAVLDVIEEEGLVAAAREKGERLRGLLREKLSGCEAVADIRGRGLMIGIEMKGTGENSAGEIAWGVVTEGLRRGLILLASGPEGNVVQLTPPLTISEAQIDFAAGTLADIILGMGRRGVN